MLGKLNQIESKSDGMWTSHLAGFSLEVALQNVGVFNPDPNVFPNGSLVFLPHLPGQIPSQIKTACQRLVEIGYAPVPHVGGRHFSSSTDLREYLGAAHSGGATRVLVLAGDRDASAGPFPDSLDILRSPTFLDFEFEHIMVSGYPEPHPHIDDNSLNTALYAKLELLGSLKVDVSIVTQFGFDGTAYIDWVKRLRDRGIKCPIRIGVAGVATTPILLKYALLCGVAPSVSFLLKRSKSVKGMMRGHQPDQLIKEITDIFPVGTDPSLQFHFFPFGGAQKTLDWISELTDRHDG